MDGLTLKTLTLSFNAHKLNIVRLKALLHLAPFSSTLVHFELVVLSPLSIYVVEVYITRYDTVVLLLLVISSSFTYTILFVASTARFQTDQHQTS